MSGLRDGELESAGEMLAALATGDVTSDELVERSFRRAEAWQPSVNAFSQLWADVLVGEGDGRHPVPLAVKDLFDVAGRETTGCCAAYRGVVADRDATVIARLRERFAFIGKTNQHELAAGGTNLVSACGRTGNPWDPARMTGGSSGGSGAAVAAGIVPMALGSDTGGSIRIPASMCGTFGLKPTNGGLPIDGLLPLAPSMDCPGPMAATASDLELLFRAMDGRPSSGQGDTAGTRAPRRIAVLEGFFSDIVHEEVASAVEAVGRTFAGASVKVESVDGAGIEDARSTWTHVCYPEFAAAHPALRDPERHRLVAEQPRSWLERGEALPQERREAAAKRRAEIGRWYRDRLDRAEAEALVIPTTPYPAPRADQSVVDLGRGRTVEVDRVGPGFMASSVNLAGLPAVNLPAGRSTDGMPIGVSLVGPDGGEEVLLALARLWEEAAGYRPAWPRRPES